mgnify:CR=1 FL=1
MKRTAGQDDRRQGKPGQTRPHSSQARTDSTGAVRQGRPGGRAQGQADSREAQQARATHHAQQARATQHAGQARQQRDEAGRGQATGNTETEGYPLKDETH